MVANAETGDIVAGAPETAASESQAENTVTAGEGPKYALAAESAKDNTQITKKNFYTRHFLVYFSDEKSQNKSLDLFC